MKNKINKKEKYGNLTIIKEYIKRDRTYCLVQCSCGVKKEVRKSYLINGHTTSCGCKKNNNYINDIIKDNYYEGTFISSLKNDKLPKNNTSGYRGITKNKYGKWAVTIGFKGKNYYLGGFDKIEDAIKVRQQAEAKYYKPIIKKYEKEKSKTTEIKN